MVSYSKQIYCFLPNTLSAAASFTLLEFIFLFCCFVVVKLVQINRIIDRAYAFNISEKRHCLTLNIRVRTFWMACHQSTLLSWSQQIVFEFSLFSTKTVVNKAFDSFILIPLNSWNYRINNFGTKIVNNRSIYWNCETMLCA